LQSQSPTSTEGTRQCLNRQISKIQNTSSLAVNADRKIEILAASAGLAIKFMPSSITKKINLSQKSMLAANVARKKGPFTAIACLVLEHGKNKIEKNVKKIIGLGDRQTLKNTGKCLKIGSSKIKKGI
jgi:hypothetical protein